MAQVHVFSLAQVGGLSEQGRPLKRRGLSGHVKLEWNWRPLLTDDLYRYVSRGPLTELFLSMPLQ